MKNKKFSIYTGGLIIAALFGWTSAHSNNETVEVKYRGPVNLTQFICESVTKSSLVQRVCYDKKNSYMLINLKGIWYHYCAIDEATVSNLINSSSLGQYYSSKIKGAFDCRSGPVPQY